MNRVGLGRDPENFTALSPLTFLPRTAAIHPDRVAIVHGDAASRIGIFSRARADSPDPSPPTASAGRHRLAVLPNVPAMLEAHHGVPMLGAVR